MLPRAVFSSRLRLLPDGRLTSRDRQVTAKLQNYLGASHGCQLHDRWAFGLEEVSGDFTAKSAAES